MIHEAASTAVAMKLLNAAMKIRRLANSMLCGLNISSEHLNDFLLGCKVMNV